MVKVLLLTEQFLCEINQTSQEDNNNVHDNKRKI